MSNNSFSKPIGLATAYARSDGSVTIAQIRFGTLSISGIWDSYDFEPSDLSSPLVNHYLICTDSALSALVELVGDVERVATPIQLQSFTKASYENLQVLIDQFLIENPKKLKTIAPLPMMAWVDLSEPLVPSRQLEKIGKASSTPDTPEAMREPLAMLRLVRYLLSNWAEVESQRTSRKYLLNSLDEAENLPKQLLKI
jgi:hypothetical protein